MPPSPRGKTTGGETSRIGATKPGSGHGDAACRLGRPSACPSPGRRHAGPALPDTPPAPTTRKPRSPDETSSGAEAATAGPPRRARTQPSRAVPARTSGPAAESVLRSAAAPITLPPRRTRTPCRPPAPPAPATREAAARIADCDSGGLGRPIGTEEQTSPAQTTAVIPRSSATLPQGSVPDTQTREIGEPIAPPCPSSSPTRTPGAAACEHPPEPHGLEDRRDAPRADATIGGEPVQEPRPAHDRGSVAELDAALLRDGSRSHPSTSPENAVIACLVAFTPSAHVRGPRRCRRTARGARRPPPRAATSPAGSCPNRFAGHSTAELRRNARADRRRAGLAPDALGIATPSRPMDLHELRGIGERGSGSHPRRDPASTGDARLRPSERHPRRRAGRAPNAAARAAFRLLRDRSPWVAPAGRTIIAGPRNRSP